jgi:hypothetical protein
VSDPASIITRTNAEHLPRANWTAGRDRDVYRCSSRGCTWVGPSLDAHQAHVGEVAAQALGLVEDRRRITSPARGKPCDNCGHLKGLHGEPCLIIIDRRDERTCGCPSHVWTPPEIDWEHRWITPWTPEESK